MLGWNQIVTFRNARDLTMTVAAPVVVAEADAEEVQSYGLSPAFRWRITWDANLAYPDRSKIGADHHVLCAGIFGIDATGTPRYGDLSRPRPDFRAQPSLTAYVKEMAS